MLELYESSNNYKYIVLAFISVATFSQIFLFILFFCFRLVCHSLYYLWPTKSFYMRAILVFTSMTNAAT